MNKIIRWKWLQELMCRSFLHFWEHTVQARHTSPNNMGWYSYSLPKSQLPKPVCAKLVNLNQCHIVNLVASSMEGDSAIVPTLAWVRCDTDSDYITAASSRTGLWLWIKMITRTACHTSKSIRFWIILSPQRAGSGRRKLERCVWLLGLGHPYTHTGLLWNIK